jgi:hypothetical protein
VNCSDLRGRRECLVDEFLNRAIIWLIKHVIQTFVELNPSLTWLRSGKVRL